MNFKELKEKVLNGEDIFVKKYLPLREKKFVIDNMIEACISQDETSGIYYIDEMAKDINIVITILLNYCDLEIQEEDNAIEIYDFIKENDVDVYDLHNNKDAYSLYDYTRDEINIKIDILNRKKTIEEIIETFLNRIIEIAEKIPNTDGIKSFLENAPEMINKISPENRDMITKIIGYDFPKKNTRKKSVK